MDEAFIGSIVLFAGNFAPKNWAICNGQILSIASNTALFSILGTTYGGDGVSTFALPDLQGRVPLQAGQGQGLTNRRLGERAGAENITLVEAQIPSHSHAVTNLLKAKEEANIDDPNDNFIAGTGNPTFGTAADISLNAASVVTTVANTGGNQAHNNMPPYLGLNYIICLYGIYPTRS